MINNSLIEEVVHIKLYDGYYQSITLGPDIFSGFSLKKIINRSPKLKMNNSVSLSSIKFNTMFCKDSRKTSNMCSIFRTYIPNCIFKKDKISVQIVCSGSNNVNNIKCKGIFHSIL